MSNKILAGRYELIEKIGEGGMAVVYKAKCRLLNRFVAIKILKPEFVKDAKFIESFRRESQSAASLSHQNIVNVYDVGKEGNIYYIVMELIEGQVLSEIIKKEGPLSVERALSITKQIAQGLSIAHKNHIIHRDVKPHNIMIMENGNAKITDFGIAKAVNSNTIVNNTNTILGSVHYFSPEQARGGYVDEKSDIYSLGIVLFEMLTGKVPFDADNPVSVAIMQINNEIEPASQLNPLVPKEIDQIIFKATDKFQTNRYKSADEMYDAINNLNLAKGTQTGKAISKVLSEIIDENGEMAVTIKEKDNSKSKQNENDGKKSRKKMKINKLKLGAVLLALILAIPASQLILNLFSGAFSEKDVKVPNVVGMTVDEATKSLGDIDLKIKVGEELISSEFESGKIMSQDPAAEMTVKTGNTITVNVSKGQKEGTIPLLTNKSLVDATFTLENYGFTKGNVSIETSDLPKDFVIRQSPEAGTPASAGASVNLVLSDGLKMQVVSMPNLVGMNIENAKQELTKIGLVLGEVTYDYSTMYDMNVVIGQGLSPNTDVVRNTLVNLAVSKGIDTAKPTLGTVNIDISYNQAKNEVFYLTVYVGNVSTPVIDWQSRNKSDGSETIAIEGEGTQKVIIMFDKDIVYDKTVNFATGEIS
ncbi:MAG: Stk1 family PASTA domain-containing Ser/Thr kinase [Eubacteriales bacterium]